MPESKPHLNILTVNGLPIYQQLQLEEALLRCDSGNWCLINHGAPPAIVMGISAKEGQWLNLPLLQNRPIPLIRRFSGGGTVVIDENTLFVTFIGSREQLGVESFPEKVHDWANHLYTAVFNDRRFALRENDYVCGERKFGGNAQYLCKDRWLHHTSFLWHFDPALMAYLSHPPKMPAYRSQRPHEEFLCTLQELVPSQSCFFDRLNKQLTTRYATTNVSLPEVLPLLDKPHRRSTFMSHTHPDRIL